jgi:hypothetical protein
MSSSTSRITRALAGVVIAAGLAAGGAAHLPAPAYATHVDAGHALRHRHITRLHAVVRLGNRRWLPPVVTGCHMDCPVEP